MSVARKFDWDEAKRLRSEGWTYVRIAAVMGVTDTAVIRACDDRQRAASKARVAAFQRSGVCVDCGGQCSRNATDLLNQKFHGRCRRCADVKQATSVRRLELQCQTCREWKPDRDFVSNKTLGHRRGRSQSCRSCQTVLKRAYRTATKQPCSHGCGTLVDTADRRDKSKPLECHPCSVRRVQAERRAARQAKLA